MEMCFHQFLTFLILQYLIYVHGATFFQLEVENYVMDKFTINRDSSMGYGSINFKTADSFKIFFCLPGETQVNLNNVRYSNDGGSDTVQLGIDGIRLGVLTSHSESNYGKEWNNFISTGPIGPNLTLTSGRHYITVTVNKTDFYGIELDQLEISTEDSYISQEIFRCSLFCDDDIVYFNGKARDDMSSAVLVRKSLSSECPTNKNLILPIYHDSVKMFLVTMMHPKYRSFENNFDEMGLCKMNNDTIWEFTDIKLSAEYDTIYSESASDAVLDHGASNTSKSLYIKVKFKSIAYSDFDTRLVIQFRQITGTFLCSCKYKYKDGSWSLLSTAYFSPQKVKNVWQIPKDTWSESNEVHLTFLIDPSESNPVTIDYLKLVYQMSDLKNSEVLYSGYNIKIEVFKDDFEETKFVTNLMSVRNVDNDQIYIHISEILISYRVPWADIYSPIIKLSRTGEMNILPIAPHGLSEIPFGSSVIIGQSDPRNNEPSAEIASIEIAPEALQLFVTFEDNGSTNMLIKSTWKDTKVIFKDIITTKNPLQYPFATVLSTWHYDGNADVDHVSTNGDTIHHIMKGWEKLYGTSFTFFRRCLSKRNTQSPDLRLQLINEKDLYLYL